MRFHLQPVQIATGSDDRESHLVFHENFLVAVLVHLSDEHGPEAGKWFLEVGFGRLDETNAPLFTDLDEAQNWIKSVGQNRG